MIIENNGKKFFVPDEIANDPEKTVAEVQASAIPLEIYNLQQEIKEVEKEIADIEAQPDEVLVPNEEKNKIPELNSELEVLKENLKNLMNNI